MDKMTERFEMKMYPDMRDALDVVARRRGFTDAAKLVRFLIAMELTSILGKTWINPDLDHPYGDLQAEDSGKALSKGGDQR